MTIDAAIFRQSRFSRAPKLPGIILQRRDRDIVTACYEYRFLSRSQLQRLFAVPCTTRINCRLRKLYDHRYLDRRFLSSHAQSSEAVYSLGIHGIPIAAEMLHTGIDEVAANRKIYRGLSSHTLQHDYQVNDVRIAVTLHCRKLSACSLVTWQDPFDCEHEFASCIDGKTVTRSIRPDGLFQINHKGKLFSFCLELDRSTCSHRRLAAKFQAYADFLAAGLQQAAFGVSTIHVLVVTISPERRDALKEIAEELAARTFFFAALQDIAPDPLTSISWHRAGDTGARALFDGGAV